MKVCVIQPEYSVDASRLDELFEWEIEALDKCDSSMDLIVMPESSDVPCLVVGREAFLRVYKKYNKRLIDKACETAKRCNAVLFVSAIKETESGERNTTYAIDREGNIVGYYYKQHLTAGEVSKRGLDGEYSYEFSEPTIIVIDGIRYAFLTCYDFYFYEAFSNIARYTPDIVIGCSHQRSDTNLALRLFSQTCAYNCNAYVVRSSVSMGENATAGGASMVVAPNGEVLLDMENRIGMACTEINPHKKYLKPMGFGNPDGPHYTYIEEGRRPWKYRPAGSAIIRGDEKLPYPRVCAHRGFNTIAPENSLPAFGAAVAMGADEIEFDLRVSRDGEIVSVHDSVLEWVSDGKGLVEETDYAELAKLDFGKRRGREFEGMRILRFEDILKKFACQTIMNIHLKTINNQVLFDDAALDKIIGLIHKYDCEKHVYFMSGNDNVLCQLKQKAPHITLCCGGGDASDKIVERAIKYGCKKVQLVKDEAISQTMIDMAHKHGIICNVFWSDDEKETEKFLEMGIDTILTNDYNRIARVVQRFKSK